MEQPQATPLQQEKLSPKQNLFAQELALGTDSNGSPITQTEAHRRAYPTANLTPKQRWEESSKLASTPKVLRRILQLKADAQERMLQTRAWSFEKGLQEIEENIRLARERGQISAAVNSTRDALKLSGLLRDRPPEARTQINTVTYVLNRGGSKEEETQALEASYWVLPEEPGGGDETAPSDPYPDALDS